MATGLQTWSTTAASNATADAAVNWAEGMAPSAVNDSARAQMASAAKFRDDNSGALAGTLSTATYSVTSNQVAAALAAGYTIAFQIGSDMPATALLNLDTLGAKPLRPNAGVDFAGGEYKANQVIRAAYFASNSGEWIVIGHRELGSEANAIVTANITAAAVTYAKIQNVTNNRLLGNFSGGAAAPSEYSVVGPSASGSILTFPFPIPGGFKNLSIKVASNTTVTVVADFITTTDGTSFQTTALNGTINLGTNGAANALDSGTIAIDTWYAIWAIAKADGTTAGLASTSATAPTLPSGYTFKARIGWVRTIHSTATLYGTWQLGRRAQYVVSLAQTAAYPTIGTTSGTGTNTFSISSFVPTTASVLYFFAGSTSNGQASVSSNSSSGTSFASNPAAFMASGPVNTGVSGAMMLESTNVYASMSSGALLVFAVGWEDNL